MNTTVHYWGKLSILEKNANHWGKIRIFRCAGGENMDFWEEYAPMDEYDENDDAHDQ